jgi:hypothetical protein
MLLLLLLLLSLALLDDILTEGDMPPPPQLLLLLLLLCLLLLVGQVLHVLLRRPAHTVDRSRGSSVVQAPMTRSGMYTNMMMSSKTRCNSSTGAAGVCQP